MKNYTVLENDTLRVPKPLKNKAINAKKANMAKIKRFTGK